MSKFKWLMSNDKGTPARSLLAVIGPVFSFRGLLSSVSGLVFAVCRPPSSVLMITNTDTNSERRDKGVFSRKHTRPRAYPVVPNNGERSGKAGLVF